MAKPKITHIVNKGSREQLLPSRHALNTLTKGTPAQRNVLQYAKLTPSGVNAPAGLDDIIRMGLRKEDR